MSIIKKKTESVSSATSKSPEGLAPWHELHYAVCEYVAGALNNDAEIGATTIETGDAKSLFGQYSETMLSYSFGIEMTPCMIIAAIDPHLANAITDARLGKDKQSNTPAPTLGLLDLILIRPFAEIALELISDYIVKLDPAQPNNKLVQTNQSLNLSDFEIDRRVGDWVQLKFNIIMDDVEPAKPAKTKKSKASPKAASKKPDEKYAFYLFLPKKLLSAITHIHNINAMADEADASGPWADHMIEAVGNAEVCLQAVLETCYMSVADCTRLSLGQIIALPSAPLHSIKLEAQTDSGAVELAVSSMGTYKSNKAVQLSDDVLPTFIADLDTIVM